jgi:L-malate glycosyltransferase
MIDLRRGRDTLRVLSVTKSTGGLAIYNTRLVRKLQEHGFEVSVLCLSENNEQYAEELRGYGLEAYTMDMERYSISVTSDLRLARQMTRFVREHQFDVVIGHGSKAGFLVRLIERMTHIPAVYALASMSFVPRIHGKKAYIYRELERFATLWGGHIVVLAESIRQELIKQRIAPANRITTIYTGIDTEEFSKPLDRAEACRIIGLDPNRPVVGWAQRLMPQKAPLDYLRAAAEVIKEVPDAQFYLAGSGQLESEVHEEIKRLKLQDHIVRAAWQSNVHAMLSAFDIYVLSSHWEGLPLSLLEAMSMGLPSVVTAVDGNIDVIEDGISGLLIPAKDTQRLAQNITRLLCDETLRNQMGEAARQRIIDAFNIDRMAQEWSELLWVLASRR